MSQKFNSFYHSQNTHKTLDPPTFVIRPKAQIGEIGGEAIFECDAIGYPTPTLFWSIEGDRSLIFPGSKVKNIEASTSDDDVNVLSIYQLKPSDNGKIIVCSAVNSVGSISTRVVLSVSQLDDAPPPLIIHGPLNQTLVTGTMTTMPCKAAGNPQPLVSWYKDGSPVIQDERIDIDESGVLTIVDLNKSTDSGLYSCVASSKTGKSTWSGFLKLEDRNNVNVKFYRAPEASMFPGQPGKWHFNRQNKNSHFPNSFFSVQYVCLFSYVDFCRGK